MFLEVERAGGFAPGAWPVLSIFAINLAALRLAGALRPFPGLLDQGRKGAESVVQTGAVHQNPEAAEITAYYGFSYIFVWVPQVLQCQCTSALCPCAL